MTDQPNNLPAVQAERPKPPLVAGGRPMAIVAHNLDEAWRLAAAVFTAKMAPPGLDGPEACMIAIMLGAEVGLTPMTAIQRIAVIGKRPTIWGDAALGLVRASGLLEDIDETLDEATMTASCMVKRKGDKRPTVRTFSKEDATKAKLWGKGGPWEQYPKRMLAMRARAFALRDVFPDVLGGLYIAEELQGAERSGQDEPSPAAIEPEPDPNAPVEETAQTDEPEPDPGEEPDPAAEQAPLTAPEDQDAWLANVVADFQRQETLEDLEGVFDGVLPFIEQGLLDPPIQDRLEDAYNAMKAKL